MAAQHDALGRHTALLLFTVHTRVSALCCWVGTHLFSGFGHSSLQRRFSVRVGTTDACFT